MNGKQLLLKDLLNRIGIEFNVLQELIGIVIERDDLVSSKNIERMYELVPKLKNEYHSDMFSCLHGNSLQKQRYPGVCMVRQMLKANGLLLKPKVVSMGYDKKTSKKLLRRIYVISELHEDEMMNAATATTEEEL